LLIILWVRPELAPQIAILLSIQALWLPGDVWTERLMGLYPRDVRIGGSDGALAVYSSEPDRRRLRLGTARGVWLNFVRAILAVGVLNLLVLSALTVFQYAQSAGLFPSPVAALPAVLRGLFETLLQSETQGLVIWAAPLLVAAVFAGVSYAAFKRPGLRNW
jgi:hypothetical protein